MRVKELLRRKNVELLYKAVNVKLSPFQENSPKSTVTTRLSPVEKQTRLEFPIRIATADLQNAAHSKEDFSQNRVNILNKVLIIIYGISTGHASSGDQSRNGKNSHDLF